MPDNLLSPEYGLSKSKLEECTANPSDVINGKTFYSGDKTKKTGSLDLSGSAEEQWVLQGSTFFANSTTRRTGTLVNKTLKPDTRYASDNTTPVVFGDAHFFNTNADGVHRLCIRYNGNPIIITANTLFGIPSADVSRNVAIKYAGRIWANGAANGSGHNETDWGANGQYCTGENGTYDARIRAKVSGQFAVYIQRNNSFPEFTSRWFNAGEELAWVGPPTYGNAQAYYVTL